MKSSSSIIKRQQAEQNASTWEPNSFNVFGLIVASQEAQHSENSSGDVKPISLVDFADLMGLPEKKEVSQPLPVTSRISQPQSSVKPAGVLHSSARAGNIFGSWEPKEFLSEPETSLPPLDEVETASPVQIDPSLLIEREKLEEELQQMRAHLLEIQQEADEIQRAAQEKSELLVTEAEERSAQIRDEAYQAGIQASQDEATRLLATASEVIRQTQAWREGILKQSEPVIIDMIQQIAKKLFGEGFRLDPNGVEQMVARAISEANRLGNLRVYLNPDDKILLVSLWQESELMVNGQKIELIPSQNILRGGCFIEGEFGSVDSRIDSQLGLVSNELTTTLAHREKEKSIETDVPEEFTEGFEVQK